MELKYNQGVSQLDLKKIKLANPLNTTIAPAFNQIGLGKQHKLSSSVCDLVKSGHLESKIVDITELQNKLNDLVIQKRAYSLGKGFDDEQYCLEKIGNKWHYYYSERGQKAGEKIFETEHDACEYIYLVLSDDPTVKQ